MFCDYCTCGDCKFGRKDLLNAKTIDGRNICDVCFVYEACLDAGADNPCSPDIGCNHRPTLISDWEPFKGEPKN